jgi:hypothetical protein
MEKYVQLDAEPQQVLLGNLQTGLQIVATFNMENVIDDCFLKGQDNVALALGKELLELLQTNGSLLDSIDPRKHINDVLNNILDKIKGQDV